MRVIHGCALYSNKYGKHFKHFLKKMKNICVLTNHRPLTYVINAPMKDASARQIRLLNYISEFTTNVRHVAEHKNVNADCLSSNNDMNLFCDEISYLNSDKLSSTPNNDEIIAALQNKNFSHIISVTFSNSENKLLCDSCSASRGQPFLQAPRKQFLTNYSPF